MKQHEIIERFNRIVADLALVKQAMTAMEDGLQTRAQPQAGIAQHVASVRAGLEDVHALALETQAGLVEPATKTRAKASKPTARKAARKKR